MKAVSVRKMRQIDREAVQRFKIPEIILMENAGIAGAFCALEMLRKGHRRVAIFCGAGNNGGDGLVCARHLLNRGLKVKIYFFGRRQRMTNPTGINYQILRRLGARISSPALPALKRELKTADLVVDALLGIGLKDDVRSPYQQLIETINSSGKPVLSLDVPSGLSADSGKICGVAIKAERTVTFGLVKKGLLSPEAGDYVGKLTLAEISLPWKI